MTDIRRLIKGKKMNNGMNSVNKKHPSLLRVSFHVLVISKQAFYDCSKMTVGNSRHLFVKHFAIL